MEKSSRERHFEQILKGFYYCSGKLTLTVYGGERVLPIAAET